MDLVYVGVVIFFSPYRGASSSCVNAYRRMGMTVLYLVGAIIALVLLVYLFVALLKPELF